MNVRPAGREACNCASPYNSILERLDAMEAEILAVQATANSAMGVANAQAGAAASSASAAAASATAAGNAAISAAADASDALTQATASAGSADDAADSASDALTALQTIEGTIASVLASDIGGKVDKLTTAGFYLYMHNGSTQGEVQPVVAPTAATIPIRDSDGRMQAADPASGATDKTLVTANWVSQTGDSAPNNLVHRSGNETKNGILHTTMPILFEGGMTPTSTTSPRVNWYRVLRMKLGTFNKYEGVVYGGHNNQHFAYAKFIITYRNNSYISGGFIVNKSTDANRKIRMYYTTDGTYLDLWLLEGQYINYKAMIERVIWFTDLVINSEISVGDLEATSDPSTYSGVVNSMELTTLQDM